MSPGTPDLPHAYTRAVSGCIRSYLGGAALEITMSVTQLRARGASSSNSPAARVTADALLEKKLSGHPITALTAYDYPTARLVDEAGIDMVLVGDSLGMVVLGYENTLPVTLDEMLHHTRAVARALRRAFLVADMPYGSYHASIDDAVRNALRFIKDAGAQAVKIEGGSIARRTGPRLTAAEIPVVAPHRPHAPVRPLDGRLSRAGQDSRCHGSPRRRRPRARRRRRRRHRPRRHSPRTRRPHHRQAAVPTIGIGAGPDCDGQILVFHDLFNLTFAPPAKFTRQYADAAAFFRSALTAVPRRRRRNTASPPTPRATTSPAKFSQPSPPPNPASAKPEPLSEVVILYLLYAVILNVVKDPCICSCAVILSAAKNPRICICN